VDEDVLQILMLSHSAGIIFTNVYVVVNLVTLFLFPLCYSWEIVYGCILSPHLDKCTDIPFQVIIIFIGVGDHLLL
jgi:hypothetical protein